MNTNKVYHCTQEGVTVIYTDINKRFRIDYEIDTFKEVQLHGSNFEGVKFQDVVLGDNLTIDEFNQHQRLLYKQAILGLNYYTVEEQSTMSLREKLRINVIFNKAQKILNAWKQQIVNESVDDFLITILPNSAIIKKMKELTAGYTSPNLINHMTFAELGINKTQVANKLVKEGILPENFFK